MNNELRCRLSCLLFYFGSSTIPSIALQVVSRNSCVIRKTQTLQVPPRQILSHPSIRQQSSTTVTQLRSMASEIPDVRSQKQVLRKSIRAQLKTLSIEEIEQQSVAVWDRLHDMEVYRSAKSIGLFLSMPAGEINTSKALEFAIQNGKDIYIPQVGANFELADMELIQIQTSSSTPGHFENQPIHYNWPRNKWGIPEPPNELILKAAVPGDIDLLIVPGLAFDRNGNRLGQGKGYYDRFIARMFGDPKQKPPTLIAVGLPCQLIDKDDNKSVAPTTIPVHEHDFPVDWVLLPNESIQTKK
jgi:5-formyltetrahydrofolate cyclo-ligase